jgi:hypothetical protein
LLEVLHRQDAGHNRHVDAAPSHAIEILEIKVILEEELGDGAGCTRIDLGREHVEIGFGRGALRMPFEVGRYRHFGIGKALDAGNMVGGITITPGMRRITLAHPADRVRRAALRCGALRPPIIADHGIDLLAAGGDAGEMGGGLERGLDQNPGTLERGAAGAIGYRNKIGPQWRQPRDGFPERALHLLGLRRKKLEGYSDA